jgi:hypothetical protein
MATRKIVEYGVFDDYGLVEGGFLTREEAKKAMKAIAKAKDHEGELTIYARTEEVEEKTS